MTKIEKKIADFLIKNRHILFFFISSILAALLRLENLDFATTDSYHFLMRWFDQIKAGGGFKALSTPVGDYGLLYQAIIAIMSYIKIYSLYQFKFLSIVFDYMLAFSIAVFVCKLTNKKYTSSTFIAIYTIVLFLPSVFENSAIWGQCDSIYCFFLIMSLIAFFDEKYIKCFVMLGIAFGFKLQSIFIIPFYLTIYLIKQNHSILHYGISIIVFWLTGIINYINGASLLYNFKAYFAQPNTYKYMIMNSRSFWNFVPNNAPLRTVAICLTIILLGLCLFFAIEKKGFFDDKSNCIKYLTLSVWIVVFTLPTMHERYTYLLTLLLLVLSCVDKRYLVFFVLSIVLDQITYSYYLFHLDGLNRVETVVEIFALCYFAYDVLFKENTRPSDALSKKS